MTRKPDPIATARQRVVEEALSWCSTPFHDAAHVKGAGADCLGLLIGVYSAAGLIEDFRPDPYSPQWFEHRDQPRFLQGLEQYAHRVQAALPGDLAMYNFGRHAAHGAIIIDELTIVHAWKPGGCVTKGSFADMLPRLHSLWSVFP
jgi:cell wall-associated NlpC family hydrolase